MWRNRTTRSLALAILLAAGAILATPTPASADCWPACEWYQMECELSCGESSPFFVCLDISSGGCIIRCYCF